MSVDLPAPFGPSRPMARPQGEARIAHLGGSVCRSGKPHILEFRPTGEQEQPSGFLGNDPVPAAPHVPLFFSLMKLRPHGRPTIMGRRRNYGPLLTVCLDRIP